MITIPKLIKEVLYTRNGIRQLPEDKPVLYQILTPTRNLLLVGIATQCHVQDSIIHHLGEVPGAFVKIKQFDSIEDATRKRDGIVRQSRPKYNTQVYSEEDKNGKGAVC